VLCVPLQAYKRAVEIDPTQTTGWQGLASFYERQLSVINESDTDSRTKVAPHLSQVYGKMLELVKEADKFENLSEKLVELNLKTIRGQYYKTFYGRRLPVFVIS
jgi:hypothetical protein